METFIYLPSGSIVNLSQIAYLAFERKQPDSMPLNHPPGHLHLKNVEKSFSISPMDASALQDFLMCPVVAPNTQGITSLAESFHLPVGRWWRDWQQAIEAYTESQKKKAEKEKEKEKEKDAEKKKN